MVLENALIPPAVKPESDSPAHLKPPTLIDETGNSVLFI
jgi:hypothetical protein